MYEAVLFRSRIAKYYNSFKNFMTPIVLGKILFLLGLTCFTVSQCGCVMIYCVFFPYLQGAYQLKKIFDAVGHMKN